jgi:hypothetical protein
MIGHVSILPHRPESAQTITDRRSFDPDLCAQSWPIRPDRTAGPRLCGINRRLNGHGKRQVPGSIDRDEVQRLLVEENAQLVEVLPAEEFAEEHIVGAVNIPLKELDERARRELDRGRAVVVYCNDYQ